MNHFRLPSFAFLASLALALPHLRAADEPPPTEITSTKLEMWTNPESTETHAIFTGNVTVTGNEIKLTCDRLEIRAERIGDKTATIGTIDKFKFLIATGKVNIVQADREANCGRAEIYPREDKIILMESPVVFDHSNGTVATGDMIEMFRGEKKVRSTNVHVTFPAIKSLSYDKNAPAPKAETPSAANPATPAPAPVPAK